MRKILKGNEGRVSAFIYSGHPCKSHSLQTMAKANVIKDFVAIGGPYLPPHFAKCGGR